MGNAFSAAMAVIFADANMAADAVYFAAGVGVGQGVRVLLATPSKRQDWNEIQVVSPALIIEVRVSDIGSISQSDRFAFNGQTYGVLGEAERDAENLIWTVGLAAVE